MEVRWISVIRSWKRQSYHTELGFCLHFLSPEKCTQKVRDEKKKNQHIQYTHIYVLCRIQIISFELDEVLTRFLIFFMCTFKKKDQTNIWNQKEMLFPYDISRHLSFFIYLQTMNLNNWQIKSNLKKKNKMLIKKEFLEWVQFKN